MNLIAIWKVRFIEVFLAPTPHCEFFGVSKPLFGGTLGVLLARRLSAHCRFLGALGKGAFWEETLTKRVSR